MNTGIFMGDRSSPLTMTPQHNTNEYTASFGMFCENSGEPLAHCNCR